MLRHVFRLILGISSGLVATMGGAEAETRALVIGIDTYKNLLRQQWLHGAVNDAHDIADALAARQVRDLTVLTEQNATRAKVVSALDALIERAQPNDLVILTFSGHGISEVWGKSRPPGLREGDKHEVFLLADVVLPNSKGVVDLSGGGDAADRLSGTELNQKFAKLNAKGARIVFVADACHGGGGTRRFLPSQFVARAIVGKPYAEGQDPLAKFYASLPTPVDPNTKIPNLTLLAAVDRHHSVREVAIPQGGDRMRGALSYSFARLVDGTARIPEDRRITRRFLFDYISATVRSNAANDQDPDLQPSLNPDQVVISASDLPEPVARPTVEDIRTVRVRTEDGPPISSAQNVKGAFDIVPVAAGQSERTDLSYVTKTGSVYSTTHDLIAENIGVDGLPGVAEREYAMRKLLRMSTSRPIQLSLGKEDRIYYEDESVRISIADNTVGMDEFYYALFDITGSGAVQVLYPLEERRDSRTIAGAHSFGRMKVTGPFGTDMFVLVTSPTPITGLISDLRRLDDGAPRALDAVDAIERTLDPRGRIGLQGFYTNGKK